MRWAALAGLIFLFACARPLTEAEETFAQDLFGPSLDTSEVTITQGLGLFPLYKTVPAKVTVLNGTDKACVRTPQPRGAQPPQAFAFRNRMHFDSEIYSSNMALGWPEGLRFPNAIILAHELTHVWQWQNREITGYTAMRAIKESWQIADPYYSASGGGPAFFSYGYEQQAAMVEDFVCFSVANPTHPRHDELKGILEPVLPVERFQAAIR